jgi:hypothetical protein
VSQSVYEAARNMTTAQMVAELRRLADMLPMLLDDKDAQWLRHVLDEARWRLGLRKP